MCDYCKEIERKHPDYLYCPYCSNPLDGNTVQNKCTHMCNGKDMRYIIKNYGTSYRYCPICGFKELPTSVGFLKL